MQSVHLIGLRKSRVEWIKCRVDLCLMVFLLLKQTVRFTGWNETFKYYISTKHTEC